MSLDAERLERRKQLIRYVSYGKTVDRPFGYVVDGFTVKIWAD
ncbi:hypothetical protein [uncultured Tessaracoccus sp.]|nr:hypothetical protein [uncultured Tessaracoccus sp.]